MLRSLLIVSGLLPLLIVSAACSSPESTAAPTSTSEPVPTPTSTPTPTPSPTPVPPTPTPTSTPAPTPTSTPTPTPTLIPTPVPTPLYLDFEPIIASEDVWNCVAGSSELTYSGARALWEPRYGDAWYDHWNLFGEHVTLCGWRLAFSEEEKRPEVLYYDLRANDDVESAGYGWTELRLNALLEIFREITDQTGIRFLHKSDAPEVDVQNYPEYTNEYLFAVRNTLRIALGNEDQTRLGNGGYSVAQRPGSDWHNRDWLAVKPPTYPIRPYVTLRFGTSELFNEFSFDLTLRHELLHAIFGFGHSFTPSSILYPDAFIAPDELSLIDKGMLRLYGDIPYEMSLEEIQRRACVGVDDICYQLYTWPEEPWWEW